MQKTWMWLKDNTAVLTVLCLVAGLLGGGVKFGVIDPLHQRFDAIDRRIDDLRADVNQRFDDQNKYINQRFDDQNKYINQRFDAVDQRFEAVDQRFDEVGRRFDAVDRRIDAVEQRLGRIEHGMSELRTLSDRVSRNEGQIDLLMQQLEAADAPAPQ